MRATHRLNELRRTAPRVLDAWLAQPEPPILTREEWKTLKQLVRSLKASLRDNDKRIN